MTDTIESLREERDALLTTQAVCHCGILVKNHSLADGHSPVEMEEPPTPECWARLTAERDALKAERDELRGLVDGRADVADQNVALRIQCEQQTKRMATIEKTLAAVHAERDALKAEVERLGRKYEAGLSEAHQKEVWRESFEYKRIAAALLKDMEEKP